MVAAEVVLADGRVVKCDEERHEDLFWALRGAGARGLGVVTRLTLRTLPEPAATSFHLKWPYERASALIAAWQEWSPTGPDGLAASLLVTVGGEAGAEPVVHLFGSMIGSETETAALLDQFVSVAGADPVSSERAHMRYGSLKNYLAERGLGDQEDEDGRAYLKSEFFRAPLPAGAVEALVERFVRGRRPGEARKLDFMPWGGAYNRVPADATAFPHRQELFLLEHSVVVPAGFDAATTEPARGRLPGRWGNAVASAGHAVVGAAPGVKSRLPRLPGPASPDEALHRVPRQRARRRAEPEPQVRAAVLVLTSLRRLAESRQRGGPRAPRRRGPRQQPTRTGRAAPRLRSRCPIMEQTGGPPGRRRSADGDRAGSPQDRAGPHRDRLPGGDHADPRSWASLTMRERGGRESSGSVRSVRRVTTPRPRAPAPRSAPNRFPRAAAPRTSPPARRPAPRLGRHPVSSPTRAPRLRPSSAKARRRAPGRRYRPRRRRRRRDVVTLVLGQGGVEAPAPSRTPGPRWPGRPRPPGTASA